MDVAFLLKQFFSSKENVSIDVFDATTLNAVCQKVLKTLILYLEIEVSVLLSC